MTHFPEATGRQESGSRVPGYSPESGVGGNAREGVFSKDGRITPLRCAEDMNVRKMASDMQEPSWSAQSPPARAPRTRRPPNRANGIYSAREPSACFQLRESQANPEGSSSGAKTTGSQNIRGRRNTPEIQGFTADGKGSHCTFIGKPSTRRLPGFHRARKPQRQHMHSSWAPKIERRGQVCDRQSHQNRKFRTRSSHQGREY